MIKLPAVLLRHETRNGRHFDWLLGDPHHPDGPLWAARVPIASRYWCGAWHLQPIEPHRRRYLTYEGPLTDDRGRVCRADQGWFVPLLWTGSKKVIDLTMRDVCGQVVIDRITSSRYRAAMIDKHDG